MIQSPGIVQWLSKKGEPNAPFGKLRVGVELERSLSLSKRTVDRGLLRQPPGFARINKID
jgi:hypothetical protein